MKLSENTKRVICTICFMLFFIGGGFNSNLEFESYLPREMFRSMIIADCTKGIAFLVMLSVFEPLSVEFKSKKYYLIIIIDIIVIIYMCYSSLKILAYI